MAFVGHKRLNVEQGNECVLQWWLGVIEDEKACL